MHSTARRSALVWSIATILCGLSFTSAAEAQVARKQQATRRPVQVNPDQRRPRQHTVKTISPTQSVARTVYVSKPKVDTVNRRTAVKTTGAASQQYRNGRPVYTRYVSSFIRVHTINSRQSAAISNVTSSSSVRSASANRVWTTKGDTVRK